MRHFSVLQMGLLAAAIAGGASAAQAALVNGDFETFNTVTAQTFTGWTEDGNVASVATTPITGSGSARMAKVGGTNSLYQGIVDAAANQYVFETDFVTSDPGGAADRSLQLNLRVGAAVGTTTGQINLRIVDVDADGDGDVQVIGGATAGSTSGTTFGTIASLGSSIVFSPADASTLAVNHLKITADYTQSTPTYGIQVTSSAGTFTANGLTAFHTSAPTSGATLKWASFETGNLATGAYYIVDNAALTTGAPVPEPASMALAAIGGLAALGRRRRV